MASAKRLGVWLDGRHVADLVQRRWPEIRCRYTEEALDLWPQNSPLLSCSLPLQSRPQDALSFCKGLLPEGQALQALAADAGLAVNETFGLLARYGRDVAGALIISEDRPEEQRFGVTPYTADTLATAVEELDQYPLGSHDDSELSLAGMQDKLLLVELDGGGWGRPLHGRPSTHILKRDDPRHPGLVEAEALCLELAKAIGLTSIESSLSTIGDSPCLIVSRFDRLLDDGQVRRVHQEDVCQALAIDPEGHRGRAKYERGGGPSLRQVARLLDSYARDPEAELDRLLATVIFTVAIGNADAHGKNLALLHPEPESVELAPLYDTVPTALWPRLRTEAAMSVGGQVSLPDVAFADILREVAAWNHPQDRARTVAERTISALATAIEEKAIPPDSAVAERVRGSAKLLADQVG